MNPKLAEILVGGVRLIAAAGKKPGGRVGLRFARGVANHTTGQAAVRGCRRALPKAYDSLSKSEKWVADQATELAVRVASDIIQQGIEVYVSKEEIEGLAERKAISLKDAILSGVESRGMSIGYDFCFGKIDRQGRLLVNLDLLKQIILAGIGEALDGNIATT